MLRRGVPIAIATIVKKEGSGPRDVGSKVLVTADGKVFGTLGGGSFERSLIAECLKAIAEGKPKTLKYSFTGRPVEGAIDTGLICGGVLEVFIDVLKPQQRVVVFGSGRVGKPLSDILSFLGFKVVVMDPNAELLREELYPYAEARVLTPVDEIEAKVKEVVRDGDVVLVTHGEVEIDYKAVKSALQANPKYVGLLGSRRKVAEFVKRLLAEGIPEDVIKSKFRGPIGVDIPADTPEEISISVAAEVLSIIKGGTNIKTLNIVSEVLTRLKSS